MNVIVIAIVLALIIVIIFEAIRVHRARHFPLVELSMTVTCTRCGATRTTDLMGLRTFGYPAGEHPSVGLDCRTHGRHDWV